jgi:hypothetical protein
MHFSQKVAVDGSQRKRGCAAAVNCVLTRNIVQTLDGKGVDAIYT